MALALSVALPTAAYSFEMVWSSGSSNIVVQSASRCTLLVRANGVGERLPSEWRLVWTATADSIEPLAFLTGTPTSGIADVCTLAGGPTIEHMLAGVDTMLHCDPVPGERATVARYVLQVAAGAAAKIKLLPASVDSVATASGQTLDQFPEVTINGGSDAPYPPVLEAAELTRAGSAVQLTSTGAYLGNVRWVSQMDAAAAAGATFQILTQSATRLTARAEAPAALPTGFVTVADTNGLTTAILAASVPLAPVAIPTDHFLVRFRPGMVDPPQGVAAGQAAAFQYRSIALQESLMTAGVTDLERLLPWFQHSDTNSTNLLGEPVKLEDLADLYVAHVPEGSDIHAIVGRASAWPEVYYATPDPPLYPTTTLPNDPYFGQQWGLWNTGQAVCSHSAFAGVNTHVADVWDRTKGDPRNRIGILDTGIDPYDPDFGGRAVADTSFTSENNGGYDTDPAKHGTAVAGIAMASGNNSLGIAGMDWYGTPLGIKVLDCTYAPYAPCQGTAQTIGCGIDRCRLKRIPIVNMSLGSPIGFPATADYWALNDICLNAFLSGLLLVASSGNAHDNSSGGETTGVAYPAGFVQRVYGVGAMLLNGQRWKDNILTQAYCSTFDSCYSSNYDLSTNLVDVIAPGGRLIVTNNYTLDNCDPNNPNKMAFGGTSAAAPFVSGLASLLRASVPDLRLEGEDIQQVINRTASNYPNYSPLVGYGYPRADAARNFVAWPNTVVQRLLYDGLHFPTARVTMIDSAQVTVTFENVPWLPQEYTTTCWSYRVKVADRTPLLYAYAGVPAMWARASGTVGIRPVVDNDLYDYRVEVPWADCWNPGGDCVLGAADNGPVFYTSVCKVLDPSGQQELGWLPAPWWKTQVAYTVVGTPTVPLGVDTGSPTLELAVTTAPSPSRSPVWFNLTLPAKGQLRVDVLDVAGRRAATVANGEFEAGSQRLAWDGRGEGGAGCRPGVYWCRVESGGRVVTRKFVLLGGR
jgi:hypothetical protein